MVVFNNRGDVELLVDPDAEDKILSLANNTKASVYGSQRHMFPTTIDALTDLLGVPVYSNASAYAPMPRSGPKSTWVTDVGTMDGMASRYYNWSSDREGDIRFRDPTSFIVDSYNELMFRAGVITATWPNLTSLIDPGLSPHQSTLANQTITQPVFQSDFRWFAGAAVLELIVVLAVLVMFRGYWKLDRQLDFSPFRIGLAFDAPLLQAADVRRAADAAIDTADRVERLGDISIRYGKVASSEKGSSTSLTDENGEPADYTRIGFGQSCDVTPLRA
jgi:hypothetical protein